jgi:hypothetical protein
MTTSARVRVFADKNLGIPFVSTLHHRHGGSKHLVRVPLGFFAQDETRALLPAIMQRVVTNRMDRIITVSQDSAREINRAFGTPLSCRAWCTTESIPAYSPGQRREEKEKQPDFRGQCRGPQEGVSYLLRRSRSRATGCI